MYNTNSRKSSKCHKISGLLFVMALTTVTPRISQAQGWSFTVSVEVTGPCGSYTPYLPIPTITNMPTQSYCESLRQTLLNIRSSQPMYDSYGNYLGDCVAYVACTPCTGSDISTSSRSEFGTGEISIDGLLNGTSFFSPHQTNELENWNNDFITKLNAMGITVTEGGISVFQEIPLTGYKEFDVFYADELAQFEMYGLANYTNPPVQENPLPVTNIPAPPVTVAAPVTPPAEEIGTSVMLLRTQADIERENKWLEEHNYFALSQVGTDNNIDNGGLDKPQMSYTESALREYVGDNIAGNFALKVIDGTTEGINEVVGMVTGGDLEGAAEKAKNLDRNIAYNAAVETGKDAVTGFVTGVVTGPALGLVKGASTVSGIVNFGYNTWKNVNDK